MRIDIADAFSKQAFPIDELQHLLVRRQRGAWEVLQGIKDEAALPQISEREFADNEGMRQRQGGFE